MYSEDSSRGLSDARAPYAPALAEQSIGEEAQICHPKSRNLPNSSATSEKNGVQITKNLGENDHSNKNSSRELPDAVIPFNTGCVASPSAPQPFAVAVSDQSIGESAPLAAEREVQAVTSGEQLFPDEIDIATSNGEQYRLDSALAKDLHDLAELDKLLEFRSKLEERVRTGIEDFMKELRLSELKTFYYDFHLSIKRGASKIDERRLREEKEDIYNYYMKLAADKYKLALFRNSAVLSGSNVRANKKQEVENGNE